jgi:hypothetical protein
LRAFAGTGQGDGWLDRLDPGARAQAVARIPRWLPEIVATLSLLVISPGPGLRARIVAFQPVVGAALSSSLVEPTGTTAAYLSIVSRNQAALPWLRPGQDPRPGDGPVRAVLAHLRAPRPQGRPDRQDALRRVLPPGTPAAGLAALPAVREAGQDPR